MKTQSQIGDAIRAHGGKISATNLHQEVSKYTPVFVVGRTRLFDDSVLDELVNRHAPKDKPAVKEISQLDRIEALLKPICDELGVKQ